MYTQHLAGCVSPPLVSQLFFMHVGDMSGSENADEALVDQWISAIIDTQDPSIVDDLRHHN